MSDVNSQIEEAANRWMQAWVSRDESTLDELMAPDFALIVSATAPRRLERADWLATARTRYVAFEFHYRDVQVRQLAENIAVMSSIAEFSAQIDGTPRNGPLFIVDVWRLTGGRWQVCSRYSANPESGSAGQNVQNLAKG